MIVQFGAFPVFVVDGTPSPLKSKARMLRFFRASGINLSSLPLAEEGASVERNLAFQKCVQECVVSLLYTLKFDRLDFTITLLLLCLYVSSVEL